ncbi:MAG TPA: LysR family transcriptional regulator [Conexibacter sp.]|nr:LysR family transcriptional regulator [Conexibacter sp.]
MTLRQLRYVLAVAELGSFTRAAEELHVSQPTLSQQVRALEAELGGPLLRRPPSAVQLTPAGHALAAEARVAVGSADRAARAARAAMGSEPLRLEVATTHLLAVGLLPACIERLRTLVPGCVVELHEHRDGTRVEQALLDGCAEIGVAPRPACWPGAVEPLGSDELVVVLPEGDPLLRSGAPVAPAALGDRGWVLFEPGHELADTVAQASERGGVQPVPAVHVAEAATAARMAAAGAGPTLMPQAVVPRELQDVCRPIDPPATWDVVALARTPAWSPAAQAFLTILRESAWWRARPRLRCAA